MFASKDALFAKSSGSYQISRSLRFRSSASAYLSRTPASTSGNQIFTVSFWIKRGKFGVNQTLFYAYQDGSNADAIGFYPDNFQIQLYNAAVSSTLATTQVFRDPSAWYHFVLAVDTTQATSTNRIKMYVNGAQITAFSTATYPAQNTNIAFNKNIIHTLCAGNYGSLSDYTDAYLAEVYWITGQALTPSSFGAFDTNGVWQPIACTVSDYGKNGFYLPFSDSANIFNDKAAIATNHSAANNWTASANINTTSSGVTYDWMLDSPTNYADGGNGRGNYATLNPVASAGGTLSDANTFQTGASSWKATPSTILLPSTGKYYFDGTLKAAPFGPTYGNTEGVIGLIAPSAVAGWNFTSTASFFVTDTGHYVNYSAGSVGSFTGNTTGTVIGIAVDRDNNQVTIYQNGVSKATVTLGISAGSDLYAFLSSNSGIYGSMYINFGQRPFTYTPPSGFSALNTQNLPTPTIAAGNKYFDVSLWTGNGSSQSITNSGAFQPDLVWYKKRSVSDNNLNFDYLRGAEKYLSSNLTIAESGTGNGTLTSFNANGFSVGNNSNGNGNGETFVGWQWKGGGTGVSNTSGSITSTVSANTSAGFSVVTFTAPSSGGFTVGHGLGVKPGMVIVKDRSNVNSWIVWHQSLSNSAQSYMQLNTTNASANDTGVWNNTGPSTSTISLQANSGIGASANCVIYAFAPVSSYSSFGSFTANSSADGVFIYTGFRPRWIICKQTSGAGGNWFILDTSRNTYNVSNNVLDANLSDAERNANIWDILSNGMKMRISLTGDFIYAAFAENPFRTARAR